MSHLFLARSEGEEFYRKSFKIGRHNETEGCCVELEPHDSGS
jgi:hypothetical protein